MSTRHLQFFMRAYEFDQVVEFWRTEQGLYLFVSRSDDLIVCHDSKSYHSDLPFFVGDTIPPKLPAANDANPGELGWVSVMAPREQGRVLLMGNIGSKSTWYDDKTKSGWQNEDVHQLFRKVAKPLRKRLRFPIWARGTFADSKWVSYRDVGYSQGAAEWAAGGGELRQEGGKNVVFNVSPDTPTGGA
jgi:hypothetical protein